ncbi:hypothetical protein GCM10023091_20740 [Ravibacter arvi]|uniref:Uncharacterized protein n=1 Tax=Ravibacter arvi TaxID=2051041 RepID=A0ABP8LYL9_9BACT
MLVVGPPGNTLWFSNEYIFKIENRESTRLLYVKNPDYPEKGNSFKLFDKLYIYIRSWLKHRKWYWCDADEYKT